MKQNLLRSVAAVSLIAAVFASFPLGAQSRPGYVVTDLGPPGNPFSPASGLNNLGVVAGVETASDGSQHAVAWFAGTPVDIGKTGLGGPNSVAGAVNLFGLVVGAGETASPDPHNENFCGFGAGRQCLAFEWNHGTITALPTLGGTNATFGGIVNSFGETIGIAENGHHDPACPSAPSVNGTGPIYSDFEAVVWGPSPRQIRELAPASGDTVGMAFGINGSGQTVGGTGTCANTVLPGFASTPHAVLWQRDGTVRTLPNLGGSAPDITVLGAGNVAFAINDSGLIAGQSTLPSNTAFHPVVWRDGAIFDLGVLPGDLVGAALNLNARGEVVGASISAPGPSSGNPRAFLWRNGVMTDLNSLVGADSPLYLLTACAISDLGEIAGFGVTADGEIHAFSAVPCRGTCPNLDGAKAPVPLSQNARAMFLRSGLGRR